MPGEWQKQPGAVVMQYNRLGSRSATIVDQLQGLHTYWANCRPMQRAPGVNFGQVYLSFDKLKQLHLWQKEKPLWPLLSANVNTNAMIKLFSGVLEKSKSPLN